MILGKFSATLVEVTPNGWWFSKGNVLNLGLGIPSNLPRFMWNFEIHNAELIYEFFGKLSHLKNMEGCIYIIVSQQFNILLMETASWYDKYSIIPMGFNTYKSVGCLGFLNHPTYEPWKKPGDSWLKHRKPIQPQPSLTWPAEERIIELTPRKFNMEPENDGFS